MSVIKVNKFVLLRNKFNTIGNENKENLRQSGIYCITNLQNEHKYVGQSVDIYKRWHGHKGQLKQGKHGNKYLQNAWNLYKESVFIFNVLELCQDEVLNEKEQYWIERLDPEYNIVKNIYEPTLSYYIKAKDREYEKEGEAYIRPQWNLWVYGGHKKEEYE